MIQDAQGTIKCIYCGYNPIKEVFDDIENNVNLWDTDDVRGSSETKSGDKWLSMNIIKQLKQRHLSTFPKKKG